MEYHIGFPLITHVSRSHNLEYREYIPSEEQCIPVGKVKAQTCLEVGLEQFKFLYLFRSVVARVIRHNIIIII